MALSCASRVAHGAQRADTDFDHHAAALVLAGHLKLRRGAFVDGWRLHDEAERLANNIGHAFTIAFVLLHRLLSEAMTSNLVSLQRTVRTFAELSEKREIVQWHHVGDLFMLWGAMKAENRIVGVPDLMLIVDRHREGTWQLQTPFFWKLIAEMLIAAGEFILAKELLDEASHLADVSPQNWVKPEDFIGFTRLLQNTEPIQATSRRITGSNSRSCKRASMARNMPNSARRAILGSIMLVMASIRRRVRFSLRSPAALLEVLTNSSCGRSKPSSMSSAVQEAARSQPPLFSAISTARRGLTEVALRSASSRKLPVSGEDAKVWSRRD